MFYRVSHRSLLQCADGRTEGDGGCDSGGGGGGIHNILGVVISKKSRIDGRQVTRSMTLTSRVVGTNIAFVDELVQNDKGASERDDVGSQPTLSMTICLNFDGSDSDQVEATDSDYDMHTYPSRVPLDLQHDALAPKANLDVAALIEEDVAHYRPTISSEYRLWDIEQDPLATELDLPGLSMTPPWPKKKPLWPSMKPMQPSMKPPWPSMMPSQPSMKPPQPSMTP